MKSMILAALAACVLCGCMPTDPRWDNLPVGIYVEDEYLQDATEDVVATFNEQLGEIYFISSDPSAPAKIKCDGDALNEQELYGYAHIDWDMDGSITGADIRIDCKFEGTQLTALVAHEVFHSFGFIEHYENEDCLNREMVWGMLSFEDLPCLFGIIFGSREPGDCDKEAPPVEDMLCQEMRDDFNERYERR